MIVLLLLTCCNAVLSTNIDVIKYLDEIQNQLQNETVALVNANNDLAGVMTSVASYRVKIPLQPNSFNPNGIRECSIVLVEASEVTVEVPSLFCINANSKFVIIHESYERSFEEIHQTERILRSVGISNTFHLISDPLAIVTFDIAGNERRIWSPVEAISNIHENHFSDLSGYHYKILYTTMEPYSSVYENAGIDISVVQIVAKHQNATIEFVKDLGSWEKIRSVFKKYRVGSVDFTIARTLLTENVSNERVYLPQWEQLCVIVPRRHIRLLMIQLVKPFTVELWVVLVFYLGIRLTRKFERMFQRRFILLLFLLVDFCLMESYLAKAISFLIDLRYEADPKTMEELDRRGETFAVLGSEKEVFDGYSGLNMIEVQQKKIWHYQRYATVIYCKMAEYYDNTESNFNTEINDKRATILKERLMLYPAFYSFAEGHPLRSSFQLVLNRMFDAGIWAKIYNKWTSDIKQFQSYLSGMENIISFADMHSLWVLLVGGYLVAVGCFAVEKNYKR